MGYLVKNLSIGQSVSITLADDADHIDLVGRIAGTGIRINTIKVEGSTARIGFCAPAGLTPRKNYYDHLSKGFLALTRKIDEAICITLQPWADPQAALLSLKHEGILVVFDGPHNDGIKLLIQAPQQLLILREELVR
ncbi:carbon storage regulator [Pseudomonas leptonychotis]|uniref:carbon storage regulator n=1 Tax=Pseudomonas leptonychotis TaxID=2448482 RepID=UPI0039EFBD84